MLSPAKINLGLQIHHRRPGDGYHYLSSIFLPIDFGDQLRIEPIVSGNEQASSAGPAQPGTPDRLTSSNHLPDAIRADFESVSERAANGSESWQSNLIWQALFRTKELGRAPVHVHLDKYIPTGGGLGGGSSNAGTLLAWLQAQYGLAPASIAEIALELGADVPFFLQTEPALLHGIGDIMEPIAIGPGLGVLCFPLVGVHTGKAYTLLKRTLQPTPPPRILSGLRTAVSTALAQSDWKAVRDLKNDFEEPVFAMHSALRTVKQAFFDHGAAFASLSGSGSSLYGLVSTAAEQQRLLERMQRQFADYRFQAFRFAGSVSTG